MATDNVEGFSEEGEDVAPLMEEGTPAFANAPNLRVGQTAFNILSLARPELAQEIARTALDPYYNDDILPSFYEWLRKRNVRQAIA